MVGNNFNSGEKATNEKNIFNYSKCKCGPDRSFHFAMANRLYLGSASSWKSHPPIVDIGACNGVWRDYRGHSFANQCNPKEVKKNESEFYGW